jgi:hypothetical protein
MSALVVATLLLAVVGLALLGGLVWLWRATADDYCPSHQTVWRDDGTRT